MQLTIDALKDAAAWPGPDQRTLVVLASRPMAAEPHWEGHPPAELYADERGAAVPLMGPADPGTATPLMLPSR